MEEIQNFKNLFNTICQDFGLIKELTEEEQARQRVIAEYMETNPRETSMVSGVIGEWFEAEKINPLKTKLSDQFNEIARAGDKQDIIVHFRQRIVDRLQRLAPELGVQNLNLLNESPDARQQLCQEISQNVKNSEGVERERQVQAFELITALQALYTGDPLVGGSNPLLNDQYAEWLCYMYLASQFFAPEDITFYQGNMTEEDFKDSVFQFLVRAVSDTIRGHNEDQWRDDPYHPANAPSCVPGATGRLLMSGLWHKGLSLFPVAPIFNDPAKAIEAGIVSQMIQDLTNDSIEKSVQLLKTLDDIEQGKVFLPEGETLNEDNQDDMMKPYPYRDFFTWDDEKKNALADRLTNDLICEWTRGLNENDKAEVIRLYKEKIKNLVLEQINLLLTNKYTTRELPDINSEFSITHDTVDRFQAGALKKLFEQSEGVETRFLEFYELSGIMKGYYKEKGLENALELWRRLPMFKKDLITPQETPEYLKLLVDWVVVSRGEGIFLLTDEEKALLHRILIVDDKKKIEGRDKKSNEERRVLERMASLRGNLLKTFHWDQLSAMLQAVIGDNWKHEVINSSLLDYLLNTTLSSKQYISLSKMVTALYENSEENVPTLVAKLGENIQKTLLSELKEERVYLLSYLVTSDENPPWSLDPLSEMLKEKVNASLNPLEFTQFQSLLNESLADPEVREKAIKGYLKDCFPYEKQMLFFEYLNTAKPVGEGCLTYIHILRNSGLGTNPTDSERAVIEKAEECWNSICQEAIQNRDPDVCRMLCKLGLHEKLKEALTSTFTAFQTENDINLKIQKQEDFKFWLSFIAAHGNEEITNWARDLCCTSLTDTLALLLDTEDLNVKTQKQEEFNFWLTMVAEGAAALGNLNDLQSIIHVTSPGVREVKCLNNCYSRAFHRKDLETCRTFLPIFSRRPECYRIAPLALSTYKEDRRKDWQAIGEIIYGEENRELVNHFLKVDRDGRVLVVGEDTPMKLEALSHLVLFPLSRMQCREDNEILDQLCQLAQEELNRLIELQYSHLLGRSSASQKQVILADITAKLTRDLTNYFANVPEDPHAAQEAYEAIINRAQVSMNAQLGTEPEFDLASFLLNTLLVLLTGGLALIAILINKACGEPDFFSNEKNMPKVYFDRTCKGLHAAGVGLFARRTEETTHEEVHEEEKHSVVDDPELTASLKL